MGEELVSPTFWCIFACVKRVYINFASPKATYLAAQRRGVRAARSLNLFDEILPYQATDLGRDFHEKHQDLLRHGRGYGYWIWKPHIFLKTLQREDLEEGDVVLYVDVDFVLRPGIGALLDEFAKRTGPIFCLQPPPDLYPPAPGSFVTKQDAFLLMGLDSAFYKDTFQVYSGIILLRKTSASLRFCQEWYEWMSHEHLSAETASHLETEHPKFLYHLLFMTRQYFLFYSESPEHLMVYALPLTRRGTLCLCPPKRKNLRQK